MYKSQAPVAVYPVLNDAIFHGHIQIVCITQEKGVETGSVCIEILTTLLRLFQHRSVRFFPLFSFSIIIRILTLDS